MSFSTLEHDPNPNSTARFESNQVLVPGVVLARLVEKYATLFNQQASEDADVKRLKSALFRDIIDYLRLYCVPSLEPLAYEKLEQALPILFVTVVARQPVKGAKSSLRSHQPCLHDATEAANRVEYPEVRKSKAHDDHRLLFEGALLILSYVFEVAGRDYNVEFFDNFDQLAEKYTRIKKYGDEISYTKERFPMTEKNLDSLERIKLLHFANVLKVALHLIPDIKKGHRTHVIQLCARIAEGPGVKYISGTGMTPATRRRVTAYEDESDIMPEPRPFRVTEVVKILHAADPVEQFHHDVANSRLNVSANEISTFQWRNPANGVRVETQEISSSNGNTVLRHTHILRHDKPIAINVNYSTRRESPRAEADSKYNNNNSSSSSGGGDGVSSSAQANSGMVLDEIDDSNLDANEQDFHDILDFNTSAFNHDDPNLILNTETKIDRDYTFRRMSLTRAMSSEPADQDIIYGNEDIDYFINGFKKISGTAAQQNTTVTSLNKDTSSRSNYRSGLSRTYSNRSDDTTATDGMSFLKGFVFRGVSYDETVDIVGGVNGTAFAIDSANNSRNSSDNSNSSLTRSFTSFFDTNFDFGLSSRAVSLNSKRLLSDISGGDAANKNANSIRGISDISDISMQSVSPRLEARQVSTISSLTSKSSDSDNNESLLDSRESSDTSSSAISFSPSKRRA